MNLSGERVKEMKNKRYIIKLWINKKHFAKWEVFAKDNQEAQEICEHLKQCCFNNGKWIPIQASIKLA